MSSASYSNDKKRKAVEMLIKAANSKTQQALADSLDGLKASFEDRLNRVQAETVRNQMKLAETLEALNTKLTSLEQSVQSSNEDKKREDKKLSEKLDSRLSSLEESIQALSQGQVASEQKFQSFTEDHRLSQNNLTNGLETQNIKLTSLMQTVQSFAQDHKGSQKSLIDGVESLKSDVSSLKQEDTESSKAATQKEVDDGLANSFDSQFDALQKTMSSCVTDFKTVEKRIVDDVNDQRDFFNTKLASFEESVNRSVEDNIRKSLDSLKASFDSKLKSIEESVTGLNTELVGMKATQEKNEKRRRLEWAYENYDLGAFGYHDHNGVYRDKNEVTKLILRFNLTGTSSKFKDFYTFEDNNDKDLSQMGEEEKKKARDLYLKELVKQLEKLTGYTPKLGKSGNKKCPNTIEF
jgi:hypothetical protein